MEGGNILKKNSFLGTLNFKNVVVHMSHDWLSGDRSWVAGGGGVYVFLARYM